MSESTPDTSGYDEKIKGGEDALQEKSEAGLGKLADREDSDGDSQRSDRGGDDESTDPA